MSRCAGSGRLGNQIFRNIATSIIAEKNDLNVFYGSYDEIKSLGIQLFSGTKVNEQTILLTDDNYFEILQQTNLQCNLWPNENYFQTNAISCLIYRYIQQNHIRQNIMDINPFKERYNNNNDCYLHIRLGDQKFAIPNIAFYLRTLSLMQFNKLYISSDDLDDEYILELIKAYPNIEIIKYDQIKTIQFASTCRYIILSTGSFSAIIGYLSFFSKVYYPKYNEKLCTWGDMLTIPGWNQIDE